MNIFKVTFQIKILTTAVFMVFLLKRSLKLTQWISLIILVIGISIIQVQNVNSTKKLDDKSNPIIGLISVISACVLSGLAGVWFEKILKDSKVSIWIRNIQLGLFGSVFALLTAYTSDYKGIQEKGKHFFLS